MFELFDRYNLAFLGIFALLCVLDFFYKPRSFPKIAYWRTKGIVAFMLAMYITYYAPHLWDSWFGKYRLIDGTHLPLIPTVIIGLFIYELGIYAWHRMSHAIQFMWRFNHQLHHSAERIDIYGALYFHPIDIMGFALVGSFTLIMVFGVSVEAATIIGFITNILAVLQHANIKTPRWLGYFVMRPEAHNVHHQRGVHYQNFGDIPHWDMLFGTYYNPESWSSEAGFFDGSSARLADILRGRDISLESGREHG